MSKQNSVGKGIGTVPCFLKKVSLCQLGGTTPVRVVNNLYVFFCTSTVDNLIYPLRNKFMHI